jgi:hypothetical protein
MKTLNGKYTYESFCARSGGPGQTAEFLAPWAGPGTLDAKTDPTNNITATLTLAPSVVLKVTGKGIPAANGLPDGVDLTGELGPVVYRIRGFFAKDREDVIVGAVMLASASEPGASPRPMGATGPFVLVRLP